MNPERLGPYRIVNRIGRGGMGTVFSAVTDVTDEPAAVKVLTSLHALDDGFHDRFAAEIESLRMLNHPNIVRILGYGDEDGCRFYAMELVEGLSLQEALEQGRKFTWQEATRLGVQLCRALKHAHDRGIIHRDIKPANLLLTSDGSVKLSDFGIAKSFGSVGMTADGGVIGTAEYMSPEQADGRPATHRSDLYSLGGVLYALLAGRPPFRAKTLVEMLQLQKFAEPEPIFRLQPNVPRALNDLVLQLLHKDPARRMPSAMMTSRALEAVLTAVDGPAPSNGASRSPVVAKGNDVPRPAVDGMAPAAGGPLLAGAAPDVPTMSPPGPASDVRPMSDAELAMPGDEAVAQQVTTDFRIAPPELKPKVEAASVGGSRTNYATRTFTPIDRDDHRKFEAVEDDVPAWISPQTWGLVSAMVALGLVVWYWLQPPSAERLYSRISAAAETDQVERLIDVERDIQDFLNYYSADRRTRELQKYVEEIDLYRLERKFEFRAKLLAKNEELSAVERAYVEAIEYVHLNPAIGQRKLQALVDLYRDAAQTTKQSRECLLLAQRQLDRLQRLTEQQAKTDLAAVTQQLKRADEIAKSAPDDARRIRRAVVELYAEDPWAAEVVESARQALEAEQAN